MNQPPCAGASAAACGGSSPAAPSAATSVIAAVASATVCAAASFCVFFVRRHSACFLVNYVGSSLRFLSRHVAVELAAAARARFLLSWIWDVKLPEPQERVHDHFMVRKVTRLVGAFTCALGACSVNRSRSISHHPVTIHEPIIPPGCTCVRTVAGKRGPALRRGCGA